MTNQDIDNLIATQVMGWVMGDYGGHPSWFDGDTAMPDPDEWQPTRDIAQAWQVVERMRALRYCCEIVTGSPDDPVSSTFYREAGGGIYDGDADTVPLAICIAALRALGVEVE